MECQNCELRQRQFYCENCLKQQYVLSYLSRDPSRCIELSKPPLPPFTNPACCLRSRYAHSLRSELPQHRRRSSALTSRSITRSRGEGTGDLGRGQSTQGRQPRSCVTPTFLNRSHLLIFTQTVRDRVQNIRNTLATRRRTLAIATSFLPSASTPSSVSPSYAPISVSPQNTRPLPHRPTSSVSSQSSTPPAPSPISRPLSATSRPLAANFFTSTSPQAARSPLTTATTPPQSYSRPSLLSPPYGRTVSGGSAPYGTPIPTRGVDPIAKQIEDLQAQMAVLSDTVARARSGLVQELVEVFSVVEVGGRPPIGGKAGTKGEWTIGGLVLPVPGDIRRE